MAQKVNIILVDDMDGSQATETVTFGLDGTTYEIDLSEKNAGKLRNTLGSYVTNARKVTSSRRGRRTTSASDTKAIRDWARTNGHKVSDRGRISQEIRQAYADSH